MSAHSEHQPRQSTSYDVIAAAATPANIASVFLCSLSVLALASGWVPGTQGMWAESFSGVPRVMSAVALLGFMVTFGLALVRRETTGRQREQAGEATPLKAEVLQVARCDTGPETPDLFHVRYRYDTGAGQVVVQQTDPMPWHKVLHLSRGDQIDIRIDPTTPNRPLWSKT